VKSVVSPSAIEIMPRYVAFLRGVMPTNAKMTDLRRCFEHAGLAEVKTVLGSGNVVFNARSGSESALVRQIEAAMDRTLGRRFHPFVRSAEFLQRLVQSDPFAAFDVPANAKRIVTFLPAPPRTQPALPLITEGVHFLALREREVFTAYLPNPRGPVFIALLGKLFGEALTTRTWDTVKKCAAA